MTSGLAGATLAATLAVTGDASAQSGDAASPPPAAAPAVIDPTTMTRADKDTAITQAKADIALALTTANALKAAFLKANDAFGDGCLAPYLNQIETAMANADRAEQEFLAAEASNAQEASNQAFLKVVISGDVAKTALATAQTTCQGANTISNLVEVEVTETTSNVDLLQPFSAPPGPDVTPGSSEF